MQDLFMTSESPSIPKAKNSVISSVGYSDAEIILNIRQLHLNNEQIELDATYSTGIMHKGCGDPILKFDLNPQIYGVRKADCTNLPLENNTIKSIMFDPPFMFGEHGQTKNNKMTKRFTKFENWPALENMYKGALSEFYRVLKLQGILIFKCQDFTDTKTTMTHCYVCNWAQDIGFYAKDLFILIWPGGRIYNPEIKQRHARKFHSYYWIFQKKRR